MDPSDMNLRADEVLPELFPAGTDGLVRGAGVLGSLAALFPWELGEKADPFASAPAGIRPEWYFLAQFYTLKLIPSHVWNFEGELLGLVGFGLLASGWVALPFWATTRPMVRAGRAWPRASASSWSAIWLHVHSA